LTGLASFFYPLKVMLHQGLTRCHLAALRVRAGPLLTTVNWRPTPSGRLVKHNGLTLIGTNRFWLPRLPTGLPAENLP